MRPDLTTFTVLPHVTGQARVICDTEYSDGRPVEAGPRRVLRRQVERAGSLGLSVLAQAEYELYLLDAETRLPPFGGTDITTTVDESACSRAAAARCATCGVSVSSPRTLNQEWGPTQYELTFDPVEGLAAGDDNFTYKTYAKEIAAQHGLIATFMSKPFPGISGSQQPSPPEPLPGGTERLLEPGRRRRLAASSSGRSAGCSSTRPG